MPDSASGERIQFSFPTMFTNWPRMGGEGIVAPIICHHPTRGDIPSIMKFFNQVLPERAKRFTHLIDFGLAGIHDWLYEGVPYGWIDKRVAGNRIYGHVAKHACYGRKGDDFRVLRDQDEIDNFTEDNRRLLAAQLCNAVLGLENLNITHGDLSPANIIIDRFKADDVRCVLIDYDGFMSPAVPMLPRKKGGNTVRLLGSPGYQHPSLVRRIKQDTLETDDAIYVRNDRFALGVLCFELMTWTSQIAKNLDRTHLLSAEKLEKGVLEVPTHVKRLWPEGYTLLRSATSEPNVTSLPGPEDWLKALGFLGVDWKQRRKNWTMTVFLKIYRQSGNQTPLPVNRAIFESQEGGAGDLSSIDARLANISYSFSIQNGVCTKFALKFNADSPVIIKRDGITKNLGITPEEFEVGPGDKILSDNWVLEFQDSSLGTNW